MIEHTSHRLIILLAIACACACKSHDGDVHDWQSLHVAAGRKLAIVDRAAERLRLFDVARASDDDVPSVEAELPSHPYAVWARKGAHEDVLIAAAGDPEQDESPALVVVSPDGRAQRHALAAAYSALEQSDDGRFAVASFAAPLHDAAAAPAQVAVIDLERAHGAVHEVAFERDGQRPAALWITPALQVEGETVHLAVASFPHRLGVLSLEHPKEPPQFLELTGDATRTARVNELIALPSLGALAWSAEGLDDVFVLHVARDDDARGYAVALAQYAAGVLPSAIAHARSTQGARLLVLSHGGGELRVLDPSTGQGPLLDLDDAAWSIATCSSSCAHAVLYTKGSATVTLLDNELAARGDRNALNALRLSAPLASMEVADDGTSACAHLADGSLALIDLDAGTLEALQLEAMDASATQLAQDGSIWIAGAGRAVVTRIDPESRARAEVPLEAAIGSFVLVPQAKRAAVIHAGPGLALSVLDATRPTHAATVYAEDLP